MMAGIGTSFWTHEWTEEDDGRTDRREGRNSYLDNLCSQILNP